MNTRQRTKRRAQRWRERRFIEKVRASIRAVRRKLWYEGEWVEDSPNPPWGHTEPHLSWIDGGEILCGGITSDMLANRKATRQAIIDRTGIDPHTVEPIPVRADPQHEE